MSAPALECVKCHAIALEEGVARTAEERESVKLALAMRTAVQETPCTQTYATERPAKPSGAD